LKFGGQNAAFESAVLGCHIDGMTDRPKRPRDANQLAKSVVDIATGEAEDKLPHASARKAGIKGGKARAKVLSPEERSDIARIAASARWKKSD
jgi:hypothetical protein